MLAVFRPRSLSSPSPTPTTLLHLLLPLLLWASFSPSLLLRGVRGAEGEGGVTDAPPPTRQNVTFPWRVLPGMTSFPSREQSVALSASVNWSVVYPTHELYPNATFVYNMRHQRFPQFIYYVHSLEDVQKVLLFAREHNLFVAVRSSGHSFTGRSTHDGALVLNLQNMKGMQFNLDSPRGPAGEVTVESGNTWLEVYRAVHVEGTDTGEGGEVRRRVIVGGSAHAVAMGGYVQGGGHSPICRKLGLAVDNLLEAELVLANGTKAVVNENGTTLTSMSSGETTHTDDASLFWALRGGGGGTWGVVTTFTFKLHHAPQRIRRVTLNWALYYLGTPIGTSTVKHVLKQLGRLSADWGGYLIVSGATLDLQSAGLLTLFLNHFGTDDSPSNSDVDDLLDYYTLAQFGKNDTRFDTFMDYEETVYDPPSAYTYIYNNFISNHTLDDEAKLDSLVEFLMGLVVAPSYTSVQICTGVLIGGKMAEVESGVTPVNPKFREGLLSMSCGISWSDYVIRDSFYINKALVMRDKLAAIGDGVYFNEPAEDLDDWKVQFWGNANTYDRLLEIKQRWDPEGFFWCRNCVGSDLAATDAAGICSCDCPGDPETGSPAAKALPYPMIVCVLASVVVMVAEVFLVGLFGF
ncbi:uncharacterized protein LOC143276955 [Babylonia areolata]|uniref:uncharacterized protein LOC143276955 n=1 Tax=Babylonia areolata TaxID=304850 RepID=UPI003FCF738C